MASSTWFSAQLAKFLEVVAAFETEESATLGAVEWAAEALDAEVVVILSAGKVVASVGYRAGETPLSDLRAVADGEAQDLPVPGFGRRPAVRVPLDHPEHWTLVLARSGHAIGSEELRLMRSMASVTSMTIRNLRMLDEERAARKSLQLLLDEQAALRRVAVLVANGVSLNEILAAIAEGAGRLADADFAQVLRYMPQGVAMLVAGWGSQPDAAPIGTSRVLRGHDVPATVLRTGLPARVDEPLQADESTEDDEAARMGRPAHPTEPAQPAAIAMPGSTRAARIRCTVGVPIVVDGELWGAVVTARPAPMPTDTERRIAGFTELAATAISNTQAHDELAASRARAVATSDEIRRRIGQELHDGVQQHLASLALTLRAAQTVVPPDADELNSTLSQVAQELQEVFHELQEMARGLHPSILAKGGLVPALRMISNRSAVPVDLDLDVGRRLPGRVEITAYYIVSEGLVNAVKHADASTVRVSVKLSEEKLRVEVRDDGVGGADMTRGSGLVGLRDRVAALGGSIKLLSMPGVGTAIIAEVPADGQ